MEGWFAYSRDAHTTPPQNTPGFQCNFGHFHHNITNNCLPLFFVLTFLQIQGYVYDELKNEARSAGGNFCCCCWSLKNVKFGLKRAKLARFERQSGKSQDVGGPL